MIKLTAQKVKCKKCVDCFANRYRHKLDDPQASEYERMSCEHCYMDRMNEKEELLVAKQMALQKIYLYFTVKHDRVFEKLSKDTLIDNTVERWKVMEDWRKKVEEILGMTNKKAVEAEGERFHNEYQAL